MGGNFDQAAEVALRRGWYLGEETFRTACWPWWTRQKGLKPRERRKADRLEKDYGQRNAERLVLEYGPKLGLPAGEKGWGGLRKGDKRKAIMAALVRWRPAASTEWIATRLCMGPPRLSDS